MGILNKISTDKALFYKFIGSLLIVSMMAAVLVYYNESQVNLEIDSPLDGIFWWIASLTTIGSSPALITDWGKFWGIILMISGSVMYLGVFTEIILWVKNKSDERFTGISNYDGKNHILIIGYNNLAVGLINFLDKIVRPEVDILLVTTQIETNPNAERVKFVKINPAISNSLNKVSVSKAKLAFVLSNDELADKKVDLNTMLIAGMIEELQSSVHTIAEVTGDVDKKEFKIFNIDNHFTFEELLSDISSSPEHSKIVRKFTKELKQDLLREEYVK